MSASCCWIEICEPIKTSIIRSVQLLTIEECDKYEEKKSLNCPYSTYILVICVSPLKESFERIVKLFLLNDLQEQRYQCYGIKRYIETGKQMKKVKTK